MLLRLAERDDLEQRLFFSEEWLGENGKLDHRTPLRTLPHQTFPYPENAIERAWKLFGRPRVDRLIPDNTDLLYAPVGTYLPVEKCPVAVTIHDIKKFEPGLPWSQAWRNRWERLKWSTWINATLRDCAVVFTVSNFSKSRIVELLGADPDDIVVVGNGVDPPFFEIAETDPNRLKRPCEAPYLLMLGGVRKKKGGAHLLAVARELAAQGSDMQLIVAGGPHDADHEEAAHSMDNVHLLGWVAEEEMPGLMRGALALLFLSPYEGFGMPAAEAMAVGTPTIVADRASLPEVVGDAGIVVEPSDTERIVEHVRTLRHDDAYCQRYQAAGRERAQRFTWDRCVDRLVNTFETVIA